MGSKWMYQRRLWRSWGLVVNIIPTVTLYLHFFGGVFSNYCKKKLELLHWQSFCVFTLISVSVCLTKNIIKRQFLKCHVRIEFTKSPYNWRKSSTGCREQTVHLKGELRMCWDTHYVMIRHIIWIKINFKENLSIT